jgi:hypothetical protein
VLVDFASGPGRNSGSSEDIASTFFMGEDETMGASERGKVMVLEGRGRGSSTIEGVRVRSSMSSARGWERRVGQKTLIVNRAMKNAMMKKTMRIVAVVEIIVRKIYCQDRKFSWLKID